MEKAPAKQLFFYSLINYIGTAIGVVSALIVYPLDYVFSGTVKYVDSISQLLFPVMILGASHALIKFYPALDEKMRKQLFNYSIVSILVISLAVFLGISLFVLLTNNDQASLFYLAFPIAVSLAFIELFKKQSQDLQKIAVPTLYEKIIPKIILPVVFLLFLSHAMGLHASLLVYALGYVFIFILTSIYLFKRFKPGFNYNFKTLFGEHMSRKDYFRYSLYSFTGSLGSLLAFRIDGIIIPQFISLEANGIFGNAVTIASVLQIPAVGMFALYAPLISGYLRSDNFAELQLKYKEVAKLLFFIGAVLFSCVFLGVDNLFRLMPTYDKLKETIPVIQILGFSVLINMATGFNGEIITYSKYYRFNLVMILLLIFLNVSLNLYFIFYTDMGIRGVAYASLLSMTLFNAIKLAFIYKKFRLIPFDASFVKMALIFSVSGIAIYFLPDTGSHFLDLVYKTGLSLVVNVTAIYKIRLVYQVNLWVDKALHFIGK
jgi:O-antigen/teichoic acid export membrane protein